MPVSYTHLDVYKRQVLNIAVVTSSMPPTGVTLPFVSYGGNALMLFMGSMGILLNISRHTVQVK